MKIESTGFTQADVENFEAELRDHERMAMADRLENVSRRLEAIGPKVAAGPGGDSWSDHELLAHIAVVSKFYGVIVHKISSGQMTELDLLSYVNLRDVVGEQMAETEPADLLRAALADQARTAKLLRGMDGAALRRKATLATGGTISAEHVARLPLINHLESHVEQLERSLG
jgi:DinB family protein